MGKFIDLTGQRFGRLTVIKRVDNSKDGHAKWNCLCDCGNATISWGNCLRRGSTLSCGCWNRDRVTEANKKSNKFRTVGEIVFVRLSNSSEEMICDKDIWFERARYYCWSLGRKGYAIANDPEHRGTMKFHVFAFPNCPGGMVRDHINGNKLDNRKSNIRFVLQKQNSQNRSKGKNNSSGHIGVSWHKRINKWQAGITVNGKRIYLGYFSNLQDAIAAREAAEIKYFGEYRRKKPQDNEES